MYLRMIPYFLLVPRKDIFYVGVRECRSLFLLFPLFIVTFSELGSIVLYYGMPVPCPLMDMFHNMGSLSVYTANIE